MANPSLQIGNSNWAIKEDNLLGYSTAGTRFVPIPITMTRASAGTRVNPQGLVETVELLGSELVTNGDFTNGSSNWTFPANWTLGNGVAAYSGAPTYSWIAQTIGNYVGKQVKVTFDAVINSGNLSVIIANGGGTPLITISGSYEFNLSPTGGGVYDSQVRVFQTIANSNFTITNISVKESTKNDLARVDYTGSTSSLLVEPQRTNLINYSEDISQWNKGQYTVQSNVGISPSGNNNASSLTNVNGSSGYIKRNLDVTASTNYTFSFYAKRGTASDVRYSVYDNTNSADIIPSTSYYSQLNSSTFTRVTVYFTTPVGSTNIGVYILRDSFAAGNVIVWGAQAEAGSFATSYIPTSGSTVTRVQDQYTKTGISDKINSEEGVLFGEINFGQIKSTARYIGVSSGTTANRAIFGLEANESILRTFISTNGSTVASGQSPLSDISVFNKIAIKWKENDFAMWLNGVKVVTDTTGATPSAGTYNSLRFTSGENSQLFFGKVKQLKVFKTALTDSELATLTT